MEFVVPAPPRFNFRRTVLSHGWAWLPPFEVGPDARVLRRVVNLPGRRPLVAAFTEVPRGVRVALEPARLSARAVAQVAKVTATMFSLRVDLEPFYRAASLVGWRWVGRSGAGRMLRAPTVFEDLVKLLLTTNCSWRATTRMVEALMPLGEVAPGGRRCFPTPAALAEAGQEFLRDEARCGYRARPLAALGRAVAAGELDVEAWSTLPREEVHRRALRLAGVGPYVVDSLLRLLGHSGGLGLDAWTRGVLSQRAGRKLTDADIAALYESFGEHAGRALWCDVTRDWGDDQIFWADGSSPSVRRPALDR